MAKFNQGTINKIETDPVLFGQVADALGILPSSMPMTLKRNGASLNQYSIVTLVASYLKKNPDDLIEKDTVSVEEAKANQ